MRVYERVRDRQPQSGTPSGACTRVIDAVETLEDAREMLARYPSPLSSTRGAPSLTVSPDAEAHPPTAWGVLERVVQRVSKQPVGGGPGRRLRQEWSHRH